MIASKETPTPDQSEIITLRMAKLYAYFGVVIKWILAVAFLVFSLFPVWWMICIVFSDAGVSISVDPKLFPSSLSAGLENLKLVFTEALFFKAYLNSLLYTLLVIIGTLLLCSLAAFEFALFDFPGKKFLFSIVLLSLMIPFAVTLIPTYLLVNDLGWVNSMQGLVVPGIASAFGLFMLTQFFQDIPRELMDAALIDGATHFGVFWRIALPLSKNALITLAVLTYITTWGNFIWPLVIATKADTFTVSQMINRYNDPQSWFTVNQIMTANFLAAIPPLLFFAFFQQYIIKGISISGLKG